LAVLRGLRDGRRRLSRSASGDRSRWLVVAVATVSIVLAATSCDRTPPELLPDDLLRSELGLTDRDRVHTVEVFGGSAEHAEPRRLEILPGDYVQFVSTDWRVHEVHFVEDGLSTELWRFLADSRQESSPPLVQQGARFVMTFEGAPAGTYAYRLEGNSETGDGVIVVLDTPDGS
jgi:plastocyanin